MLNARSETESKKAFEPISVLTIAVTMVATKLVDGFVGQIGGDAWTRLRANSRLCFNASGIAQLNY